jgi:hypothetical protein
MNMEVFDFELGDEVGRIDGISGHSRVVDPTFAEFE